MKKLALLSLTVVASLNLNAQTKKQQDIDAIKSLCGCYEIDFDYTETFAPDTNYKFHDDYHTHAGAELAFIVEENENFISIQHLLVVGGGMVIKHWREDWVYENQGMLEFKEGLNWGYKEISKEEAKGTWTQKVFQVDDSPRYDGYATWVHVDGRHFWHSKTDGPLPRREYSKRSDYNVLRRTNRIELTEYGWIHEQDNTKIIRDENGDLELAQEKGYNKYMLQDDSKCDAAVKWWNENKQYWALVREEWAKVYDKKEGVHLAIKKDDKTLWEELFALGDENKGEKIGKAKAVKQSISGLIQKFALKS